MEKINLLVKGENQEVDVIRYFHQNDNQYLIYSLNELDPQGYIKLYIVKVESDTTGNISASNVTDEIEWNNVKETIKNIIKSNKEGNLVIDDLDYNKLNNLVITDNRVFKLSSQLVETLGENKKVFYKEETPFEPSPISETVSEPSFESNFVNNTVAPSFELKPDIVSNDSSISETPLTNQNEESTTNYEVLYEAEKNKNIELTNKINELQTKIDNVQKLLNS